MEIQNDRRCAFLALFPSQTLISVVCDHLLCRLFFAHVVAVRYEFVCAHIALVALEKEKKQIKIGLQFSKFAL